MARISLPPTRLLSDPDVRRWFDNLARGSRATADVNLRRLDALCKSLGTTPADLARLDEKEVHDRFLDFVSAEEKRQVAGSYIVRTIKAGKSWLVHNGKKLERPIRVRGAKDTPSLRDERVPTQEELRKVLLAGSPRIRAAAALVAFSGLRPEVLGNYIGDDGLRLGDFPELKVGRGTVQFMTVPTLVRVRPELSKSSNGYYSFLSEEGCSYLRHYLEDRLRAGEKLGPDTDLIHPDRAGKRFIRTLNIGDAIRTAIRGAGFPWRPYVLRHYFDTQLLTAESKGKVAHDFRVYWMGHVGSIDARYTTNKRQLPKELVEEMRAAYRRCEPFLSTVPSRTDQDAQSKMAKVMLMGLGYTEKELAKLDFDNLDVGAFQELVTKKMGQNADANGTRQRLVEGTELPRYLDEGWTVVTTVNGHQVVLNPPGSR
ncbi:MAG TPA: site-specific integrase [Thermoplasmata archaeon]|nr:site-specific integrase [Thermoplasmata archaeon]